MRSIFETRKEYKPFEYDVVKFAESIWFAHWTRHHWKFESDVHDFSVNMNDAERKAIRNALLAISQIEVDVKSFWANIGNKLPKPEISIVGSCFANNEGIHSEAYSHLLEKLNLNADFKTLVQTVPEIQGRVDYLKKYLKGASSSSNEAFTLQLALFSVFVEYVSLFSQFAIIKSFNKHKQILKDVDNLVSATFREEQVHGLFGINIINIIKEENPDWFNEEFYSKIYRASKKAYAAEAAIIDWIFEDGHLDFISPDEVKEFVKYRFNEAVTLIGGEPIFEVDGEKLSKLNWFLDEIAGEISVDFFHKKSTDYSKSVQSITDEDLF